MEFLIVLLISAAVWILQYVFKGPEENKQQQQQQPGKGRNAAPAQPRPNPARPRRPVNDLDRFLEETRKRKQQEERKPVVIAEAVNADPNDRAEAVERERRAQAARPRPQAPQPARSAPRQERRPERAEQPRRPAVSPPRETPSPVMLEAVLVEPIPSPPPPPSPPPLPPPPPRQMTPGGETIRAPREAAQAAASVKKTVSPVLVDVVRMLRKPQGALLALVLREIFDAPVSRRNGMK